MMADLVVPFGPRSMLSLIGSLFVIGGVWFVDRIWDEEGASAYKRAKERDPDNPVIPPEELDAAFRFPVAFLLGWTLLALSFLFPTSGDTHVTLSAPTLAAIGFSLVLGIVASVPMGSAVRHRQVKKKQLLSMLFAIAWVGLAISSGIASDNGALPFVFSATGALSIVVAMKLLWKYRKMGDSWEQDARPNPNPIVYNMGGPLFVLGWFLVWIAIATADPAGLESGLPIYFNWRTMIAFFTGFSMVPIVIMIDYAHDEGGTFVGLGTDGASFGRLFESPVPFVIMWTLFGFSSFLALDNTLDSPDLRRWLILLNSVVQAVVAGGLIQTATYQGDLKRKTRFGIAFMVLFLILALNIGLDGGPARYLAPAGAVLTVLSQRIVFGDRKRGDYWMTTGEVNPNPIVYSAGAPLFMAGWILLAWAMSLSSL